MNRVVALTQGVAVSLLFLGVCATAGAGVRVFCAVAGVC